MHSATAGPTSSDVAARLDDVSSMGYAMAPGTACEHRGSAESTSVESMSIWDVGRNLHRRGPQNKVMAHVLKEAPVQAQIIKHKGARSRAQRRASFTLPTTVSFYPEHPIQ